MTAILIDPSGKRVELTDTSPEVLAQAQALGYRLETEEAPQTTGEQVRSALGEADDSAGAAIEGLASGLTGGLSGYLQGQAANAPAKQGETPGQVDLRRFGAEETLRRKEEHPIAAGVGDFAGMVVSPLGKAGEALAGAKAATRVGRIAQSAASNAAVGSLYGAGNALSESALGDSELTAEQLVSGAGLGALLGGAGGGLGQALAEGAGVVASRLAKADVGEWLTEFASNKALKAAGATKRDLDYLGAKAEDVGKVLLERGHLGQGLEAPTATDVLASVGRDKEALGAKLGKVFDDAAAAGATPKYSSVYQGLDAFEAGLSPLERKAMAGALKDTRSALDELGMKPAGQGFSDLNKLKQDLQAQAKWSANADEFTTGLKRRLSAVVREELDNQIGAHLGPAAQDFLETKRLYGLLADAERVAEHGAERIGGNAAFGLRDIGLGAAGFLKGGNPVTGLVSAVASKVWRERGDGIVARLAAKLADSPAMSAIATSFSQQLGAVAPALGRYGGILTAAAAQSPQHALATHMALGQIDPGYEEAARGAGFVPEDPAQHAASEAKGSSIATMAAAVQAHHAEVDRQLGAVLRGDKPPPRAGEQTQDHGAKRLRKTGDDAHRQHVAEVAQLAADQNALLERVAANMGNVANVAPATAAAMTATANKAMAYLAKQAAQPARAGPLAKDWVSSDAERHAYRAKRDVVLDPARTVLAHAAAGTLTKAHVEALNAVYPMLARDISDRALARITEAKGPVPYRARLMVALLTGVDVDGTMGRAIAANQAAIRGAEGKPSERLGGAVRSEKGADALGVAQRSATPSQRREMRVDE